MIRRCFDQAALVLLLVFLTVLARFPAVAPATTPVAAADAFSGSWVDLAVDNGRDSTFVFFMRSTREGGIYQASMDYEGRRMTLCGTTSSAEFQSFVVALEAHRASASTLRSTAAMALPRRAPRYTIFVQQGNKLRHAALEEPWSPQYQALQRFLDRTVVGRTEEALRKSAGL